MPDQTGALTDEVKVLFTLRPVEFIRQLLSSLSDSVYSNRRPNEARRYLNT